jgi:hypothetical protein
MACGYISSNDERLYAAVELAFGQAPAITGANRFPALKMGARQVLELPDRRDKTGTRTYPGTPAGLRKKTTFELATYLTSWTRQDMEPGYGPLFQAALGGMPVLFAGGTAAESSNARLLRFQEQHGLGEGQGVTFGGEIRFVMSIVDATTVELNAPFSVTPSDGSAIGATVSYGPATSIETVSLFDYWSPAGAVNRILCGSVVERMRVAVNGDYHEVAFSGLAKDILDTTSFVAGQGELAEFPAEPVLDAFDYTIIPGHLGQAWLGNTPDRFHTITAAEVLLENDIDLRTREFGSDMPMCVTPGQRTVTANVELFELNDAATKAMYQAARQSSPVPVMFQLGQQPGQLFGVYLKSVVPSVPEFDDSETRLKWSFSGCRAQGTGNDEIFVAFG